MVTGFDGGVNTGESVARRTRMGRGECAVRSSRFAVRGSQFAVRGSRFAVRGSRFAVRSSRFSVMGSGRGLIWVGGGFRDRASINLHFFYVCDSD